MTMSKSWKADGNCLIPSSIFPRNFRENPREIRESFARVSRVIRESFTRVSREFRESFAGVSREYRESIARVSREFRESFARVSREFREQLKDHERPEIKATTRDSYQRNLCTTVSEKAS
jgi:phosphate uptake regulator